MVQLFARLLEHIHPIRSPQQGFLALLENRAGHGTPGVGLLDAVVGAKPPAPLGLVPGRPVHGSDDVGPPQPLEVHRAMKIGPSGFSVGERLVA